MPKATHDWYLNFENTFQLSKNGIDDSREALQMKSSILNKRVDISPLFGEGKLAGGNLQSMLLLTLKMVYISFNSCYSEFFTLWRVGLKEKVFFFCLFLHMLRSVTMV